MSSGGAPSTATAPGSATGSGHGGHAVGEASSQSHGSVGAGHRAGDDMSINDMIAATPLGPILDRPVSDVLAGLTLPAIPQIPELPPLPGLPDLPTLDLSALLKPITDLLGGFGTGNLSTAAIDPTALFTALSGVLDTAMSTSSGALKVASEVWDGQGSQAAIAKNVKVTSDTTAVSKQGTTMSIDIQVAAAIVGTGLAQLQGIIAATVGKIGATLPIIATPAGQGLALGFAAEGLSQAITVVTATRAQLLGPTANMNLNGLKVRVTNVPGLKGVNPFSVAGSVVDTVTPVVGAVKQIPTNLTTPNTPTTTKTVPTTTTPAPVTTKQTTRRDQVAPTSGNDPVVRTASLDGLSPSSAGLYGNSGATPTGSPSSQTPAGSFRPAMPTGADPAAATAAAARNLTGGTGFGTGAPMVSAPGTAGGRGSGDGSQGSASYLVSEDNGRRVVGDVGGTAPAVFGADNESGSAAKQSEPDIALRLNLALDAGSGKN